MPSGLKFSIGKEALPLIVILILRDINGLYAFQIFVMHDL